MFTGSPLSRGRQPSFRRSRSSTLNFSIPYPRPQDLAYPARVLSMRGASRGVWSGAGSAPAGVGVVPRALGRPWVPSGPITRVCLQWLDGDRRRRETVVRPRPRKHGPEVLRRRDGASKGVAVASISRRSGKQAAVVTLPRCVFRRSASLSSHRERGPLKLPFTRRILRAAMTLAWRKGR